LRGGYVVLSFGTRRKFGLTGVARLREDLEGSRRLYGLLRASLLPTRPSTAFPAPEVRLLAGICGVSKRCAGARQDSIRQFFCGGILQGQTLPRVKKVRGQGRWETMRGTAVGEADGN